MNIIKEVGKKILKLRTSTRQTQQELADKAEISVSFLSMIERGERAPHLETLDALAKALEVPIAEFFAVNEAANVALYAPILQVLRQHTLAGAKIKKIADLLSAMLKFLD